MLGTHLKKIGKKKKKKDFFFITTTQEYIPFLTHEMCLTLFQHTAQLGVPANAPRLFALRNTCLLERAGAGPSLLLWGSTNHEQEPQGGNKAT